MAAHAARAAAGLPGSVDARRAGRRGSPGRERGFTLMEILIAMTIMLVGLLPMLAVFRVAIANLNRAIEDTYASAIAQSVIDAIRFGMRDMLFQSASGPRLFIFDHEGSEHLDDDRKSILREADLSTDSARAQILGRDYTIVLPNENETVPATGGGTPIGRAFLYPRKDPGDNAARRGMEMTSVVVGGRQVQKPKIERTYQLGRRFRQSNFQVERDDTYQQYSFAFTIRCAKSPDPLQPVWQMRAQNVLGGLYEVNVRVFRNFSQIPTSKRNDPVGGREFITYVAE